MALTWPIEQEGSKGEDVMTVQYLVTAQGHPTGEDGVFGLLTRAAAGVRTVCEFGMSRGRAGQLVARTALRITAVTSP